MPCLVYFTCTGNFTISTSVLSFIFIDFLTQLTERHSREISSTVAKLSKSHENWSSVLLALLLLLLLWANVLIFLFFLHPLGILSGSAVSTLSLQTRRQYFSVIVYCNYLLEVQGRAISCLITEQTTTIFGENSSTQALNHTPEPHMSSLKQRRWFKASSTQGLAGDIHTN